MPAAQDTLTPLLPTTEVSEMGTDVVAAPCSAGGCGMQVCVICVCVSIAAASYDLCLTVFVCQLASAYTSASWRAVACFKKRDVCIFQPAVENPMNVA